MQFADFPGGSGSQQAGRSDEDTDMGFQGASDKTDETADDMDDIDMDDDFDAETVAAGEEDPDLDEADLEENDLTVEEADDIEWEEPQR